MSSNNLTKSAYEKDQNDNNLCKKHASRCDKDYYRSVCPSKLSKRELEDLYYSLLENNLELKRTINAQTEKNRILSTKVQRMTSQTKAYTGKDCCAAAKAVINEQREGIADLTKANEALADRIRKLSTQLCTTKQFLKHNPSNRSCYKCFANTHNSIKIHSSMSLQNKSSAANLKSAAVSTTQIEQEPPSTRAAETNTLENGLENVENVRFIFSRTDAETVCSENKCRSIVEQFKQKIEDLEEELAKTHTEYSSRMTQLENQVSGLQSAVLRARSEQSVRIKDSLELVRGARNADADKAELETQLSIEKRKVAELEMQLKAAELSQQVAKTVENHLSTSYQLEEKQLRQTSVERCSVCSNVFMGDTSPRLIPTTTSTKTPNELTVPDDKLSKSDDSGYADHRQETDNDEKNNKTNLELMKRIEEIQAQLDALQLAKAEKNSAEQESSPYPKTFDYYYKSDDEQDFKDVKTSPKPTRISISEREATVINVPIEPENTENNMYDSERKNNRTHDSEKLNAMIETDTPAKDNEYLYREIYVRNDSNSDKSNETQVNNSAEQVVENCSVKCECPDDNTDLETNTDKTENNETKSPEKLSRTVNIEDQLNYPKETEQGDFSNNIQTDVEIVIPKPINYYNKSTTEIPLNGEKVTSNRHPSIIRNSKPLTNKNDDNFQQIPGPIPINDSAAKRRVSLTKKKIKPGGKRKIEPAKDQSKDDRNKKINKKDKKVLGKTDQRDLNDIRKVEPSDAIRHKETQEPKSEGLENENLPFDDKTNSIRRIHEYGSILRAPIGSSTPKAGRPPTPISAHTYTIDSDKSRPNSPANTEHEISVMTDLPSENDDLYDRLSPGEHRTIATSTDTTPRQYTLSEGEVPVNLKRRTSKSLGEVPRNDYTKEDSSFGEQRSPAQKMEATLQVISQELARCRSLLQTQRSREQKNAATTNPVSLVLRKTEGRSHFVGTVAPSCLFTMHVVTVVLSDEAIVRSRDTHLVLKWRFEHKTTMTPLSKGRVTYFDFSTQYGLQMTKEVEEYLKNEDMLILICEMDSTKEPFATCALPLRQVLLNVNRRVDMSLPLRAGPYLKEKPTGIPQANDDVGVLDVWCMLLCK
ncbi:restin homolog isoform X2 [Cydia pomonella]|uniref:restin homolog isoform X2 n=1 Tax=Cydia pomonella TaxID=82600 RepID=UPI002ADD41BB|nr:restin homolog isoform X2 [Cydia pomonella]